MCIAMHNGNAAYTVIIPQQTDLHLPLHFSKNMQWFNDNDKKTAYVQSIFIG